LGYVDGRNLAIDFQTAEGRLERLPGLAADLIAKALRLTIPQSILVRADDVLQ
jgi:hypothetical protein